MSFKKFLSFLVFLNLVVWHLKELPYLRAGMSVSTLYRNDFSFCICVLPKKLYHICVKLVTRAVKLNISVCMDSTGTDSLIDELSYRNQQQQKS